MVAWNIYVLWSAGHSKVIKQFHISLLLHTFESIPSPINLATIKLPDNAINYIILAGISPNAHT